MKTASMILIACFVLSLAVGASASETVSGIAFDHALHIEMDMDCDACHGNATTSKVGTDWLLPEKAVCADCHDVDDDGECGTCHIQADDPTGYAAGHSPVDKFSHAAHLDAGMDCAECHGADPSALVAVPAKSDCRSCHVTASDLQDCGVCHSEGAEYVPATHGLGWDRWHGVEAGAEQESCANCHAQVDCQDCHSGDNVRPRSHPLNFAFSHAVEARSNEMECATCHEDTQFCSSCHVSSQVLPMNHSRGDWVMGGGDGGQHAMEARFEMESCIACHDNGTDSPLCANCHGR